MNHVYELTRREFLALASLVAAGGAARELLFGGFPAVTQVAAFICFNCQASFARPNRYIGNSRTTYHCPNCGVDLLAGRFRLSVSSHVPRKQVRGDKFTKEPIHYAQVPFPNRMLVENSIKPTVVLGDIRFRGVTLG